MEINPVKLLIIDCFDSFSYNLYHLLDDLNGGNCKVIRYDQFNPNDCAEFTHVVLSPGPGLPADYQRILRFLEQSTSQSILGVCLGLQCMITFSGGKLKQLEKVKHGISTSLIVDEEYVLFKGISSPTKIGHYHSWVADENHFPSGQFRITSKSEKGEIMSIQHSHKSWFAVQFHPESIMTEFGRDMLKNWLSFKSS